VNAYIVSFFECYVKLKLVISYAFVLLLCMVILSKDLLRSQFKARTSQRDRFKSRHIFRYPNSRRTCYETKVKLIDLNYQ
jgi:hypothetical protein